jgi:putative peptidoglycan lipid II flippase
MTTRKGRISSRISGRIGKAALIVSAGVLLSRVLGQLREIIFAALLGASSVTDQYVAAFRIPDFLNYLLAGGFLSITFIPIFARYLANDDEQGGWRALTAIIRPIAIGITTLVIVGWVLTPTVIRSLYPDFTADQTVNTIRLTRIVLPAQVFFVVGALFSAVQYAKGVFVVPTLAPIVYNLGIILGGIADAALTDAPGPDGFIWGALAGAFAGNFALQWWGAQRVGMRWVGGTQWNHPALAEYLKIALPLMIGQSIVVLDETFMSVFGNRVGEAAQTQLQYARRTMLVPVGAIAQAASVAAYPYLALLFAEGRRSEMGRTVDRALSFVLVLSMAATALLLALSQPVIQTLFQRGQFTAADTVATARALFFYAFAVPIWGGLQILSRAFYATRDMWTPVVIGTAATVVAVPLFFGLQGQFGLAGVALASTVALGAYTAALAATWYGRRGVGGRLVRVLDTAARAVPVAVAGGAAAYAAARLLSTALGSGWLSALAAVVVGTGAFGIAALATGALLLASFGAPGHGTVPAGRS